MRLILFRRYIHAFLQIQIFTMMLPIMAEESHGEDESGRIQEAARRISDSRSRGSASREIDAESEDDRQEYCEKNYSVEATGCGMIMVLLQNPLFCQLTTGSMHFFIVYKDQLMYKGRWIHLSYYQTIRYNRSVKRTGI